MEGEWGERRNCFSLFRAEKGVHICLCRLLALVGNQSLCLGEMDQSMMTRIVDGGRMRRKKGWEGLIFVYLGEALEKKNIEKGRRAIWLYSPLSGKLESSAPGEAWSSPSWGDRRAGASRVIKIEKRSCGGSNVRELTRYRQKTENFNTEVFIKNHCRKKT